MHISVINQSLNVNLVKIIQKVGGTNDTLFPPFKKWGEHVPPSPSPLATPMVTTLQPPVIRY